MKSVLYSTTYTLLVCWGMLCPHQAVAQRNDPQVLWGEVSLYRDEWGVPHIYANNARAMAFAFGYAQAEDHLEDMLFAYRVAGGRAAAVRGEAYAASDVFALTVGHRKLAEEALLQADGLTLDLCEGFALGVNAWLYDHAAEAPDWAEGVSPADVLALWHSYMVSFAPLDLPNDYQRPWAAPTGNAWALAADRTKDNAPYLVINPHQYHDGPFRWYEAHLVVGDMNVIGATLFGLPVIMQGHTENHGWALTPSFADTADIFAEPTAEKRENPKQLKKTNPLEGVMPLLEYYAQAQPYYVLTPTGLEERMAPAHYTPDGPLLDQNGFYTWCIGGYKSFGALSQFIAMARAQNFNEFQDALTIQQLPSAHVTYADRDNNLFYLYNAITGTRDLSHIFTENEGQITPVNKDFSAPLPRRYLAPAWGNIVPVTELPHIINPPNGYLQASGSPPWGVTTQPAFAPGDWPAWFIGDIDSQRGQRVRQLLRNGTLSFRDMQSMLYDVVTPAAITAVRSFIAMVDEAQPPLAEIHPDLPKGIELLRTWNFLAETNNPGMTFYHLWWNALRQRTQEQFSHDAELLNALKNNASGIYNAALTAAGDAARSMRNDLGEIVVPWGEVHKIQRGTRSEALPGSSSGEPLFIASDRNFRDGAWQADYGYGFAMAVRFDEKPHSVSMVPFGSSENPTSPHYADQLELMLEKRFKVTRFSDDAVQRYAQEARGKDVVLQPLGVEGKFHAQSERPLRARMVTQDTPPGELPEDLAAFSLFMHFEVAHGEAPLQVSGQITVPETLCQPQHMGTLRIYQYSSTQGWVPLDAAESPGAPGTITGTHDNDGYFAVLGPKAYFIAPPKDDDAASEDVIPGEDKKPKVPQPKPEG